MLSEFIVDADIQLHYITHDNPQYTYTELEKDIHSVDVDNNSYLPGNDSMENNAAIM